MKPYNGSQITLHFCNNNTNKYQTDESGEVDYHFNEFGYRKTGREYEDGPRVFTFGCSLTFGTGISVCDTWSNILTERLSKYYGQKFSLWNFAQGGASNDFITRSVFYQLQDIDNKPKIVIIQFTLSDRTEYISQNFPGELVGPWGVEKNLICSSFYGYFTEQLGEVNMLKNMLLCKFLLDSLEIPYVFTPVEHAIFSERYHSEYYLMYLNFLDFKKIATRSLWDKDMAVDLAKDNSHPGPITNKYFAEYLHNKIMREHILE